MKLERLYSNNEKFKNIEFNEGLNIILGKISNRKDNTKDTHNLGKSTLIYVIDYMLLKEIDSSHIFKKHINIFKDYIFYIEIKVNNNKFVTIKRKVDEGNKVSIKIHEKTNQERTKFTEWDYENIPISTKSKKKQSAKIILNDILEFNVVEHFNYRNGLNYFLRSQQDYNDIFRLNKFSRSSDKSWKPYLFSLLGFNDEILIKKYESTENINLQKNMLKEVKGKLSIDSEEVDKINGLIEIKRNVADKLQEEINSFNFYGFDDNITKNLVNGIENNIAKLNTLRYKLEYDIDEIQKSLENNILFDLDKTEMLFNEVKLYFPNQLKKSYEELIQFNKEITSERHGYLEKSLKNKKVKLLDIDKELKELNEKRIIYMEKIKEKDTFNKFRECQAEVVNIEKEISELDVQLNNVDIVNSIEKQKEKEESKEKKYIKEIKDSIEKSNDVYKGIRILFNNYVSTILNWNGLLSITPKKTGNIEFEATILDTITGVKTSQADGNSYKKIICVCFDLAILSFYSKLNYFKFVYHDGSFESLDDRKKINYIDLIKKLIDEKDLQIIITMIEDDIPYKDNGEKYKFTNDDIILELNDNNEEGTLFGIRF